MICQKERLWKNGISFSRNCAVPGKQFQKGELSIVRWFLHQITFNGLVRHYDMRGQAIWYSGDHCTKKTGDNQSHDVAKNIRPEIQEKKKKKKKKYNANVKS